MASSILNQIYKEAAVTSKGVVQMNRTLNKVYDDQEKSNKRQDKFLEDLRNRQKRDERDEKKRQSDLKKLIAGASTSSGTKSKDTKEGFNLGDGKGLLPAITGGLSLAFNLLKGLLITSLLNKLRGFFRLPGFGRGGGRPIPPTSGGGRGGRGGSRGGGGRGGGGRGGSRGGGGGGATTPAPTRPIPEVGGGGATPKAKPGGKTPPKVTPPKSPTGNSPLSGAGNTIKPTGRVPIKPSIPWWKKMGDGIGGFIKGAKGFLGRWAGPLITFAMMAPEMKKMYDEKRYKDLTRYILAAAAGSATASLASSAVTGLAVLAGIPTGGFGGVAVFLTGMAAAMGAGNFTAGKVDELLFNMGLTDEDQSTGELPNEIPQIENPDELSNVSSNKDKYEGAFEHIESQKKQKGGGIFDVPGHGQGDQVPMMLPPGAFVLNRVAAQEMFARGGSPSGMVPTLLEPGEKVFMPGDPLMDMAMSFNSSFSRFQTGGMVGQPTTDSSTEKATDRGGDKLTGLGGSSAVISVGKMLQNQGFTVKEHPNFAGRDFNEKGTARVGGHSKNSLHYKNLAVDVTDWREGNWQARTAELAERMYQKREALNLTQIIHDPWGSWFAGDSAKGGAYGGHDTHLHLGFASGKASDKGYIGPGNADTPGTPKQESGSMGGLGAVFAPITNAISGVLGQDGPIGKIFGQLTDQMSGLMGKVMEEVNSPETQAITSNLQKEMGKITSAISAEMGGSSPQVSPTAQPSSQHMKVIRDAMDPESNESPTVVQVIPSQEETKQATVSGTANQNLPPGLSTRCSSWASADYRYDRSLNCETL